MADCRWDSSMPQNAEEVLHSAPESLVVDVLTGRFRAVFECVAPPWLYQHFKTPLVPLTLAQLLAFLVNTCSEAPCSFQCSIWKRLMITMREAPLEARCLGSLLFPQPALLWVLPAGWHELAVTFLNLDASSMETYDICFFFSVWVEQCFPLHKYRRLPAARMHTERHTTYRSIPFVAWGWALGAQDLSYEWFSLFLCLFVYLIRNQDV